MHNYSIIYSEGELHTSGIKNIPNEHLCFFKESWVSESRNIIPVWTSKAASNKKAELGFYFHESLADFDKATETVRTVPMEYVGMKMHVKNQGGKKKYFVTPIDESYPELELKFASSGIQTSAPLVRLFI